MQELLDLSEWLRGLHWSLVAALIVFSIAALGWGAERLVQEAVALSERGGIPKVVIGATIVSLGTTAPEVAVSVMAALGGNPELAMGNAVGSIICDTGLVLGVACLIRPLHLPPNIVNRQGWVQLGSGLLLVAFSWPWADPLSVFDEGRGRLPQALGFVLLGLLAVYLYVSVRWAREARNGAELEDYEGDVKKPLPVILVKLALALAVVIVSSHVLIQAVTEAAQRLNVPNEIIAATLLAFGTSLPELVTAVTAARHGHGDLAVGNVVGADVLNALFVAGAAAAVTPGGLDVSPGFFHRLFPAMVGVLLIFRIGIFFSHRELRRGFGVMLLAVYAVTVAVSYLNS